MDADRNRTLVDDTWTSSIVPTLEQYIRIPNQSPLFDPDGKRIDADIAVVDPVTAGPNARSDVLPL